MILVGVPHTRPFEGSFTDALWSLKRPEGTAYKRLPNRPVDDARNRLAVIALREKAESLLFWDSDMRPPAGGLLRLVGRKKDVVTCLTFGREWPHRPVSMAESVEVSGKVRYRIDLEETYAYLSRHARLLTTDKFTGAMLPPDEQDTLVPRAACGMAFTLINCKIFETLIPNWREIDGAGETPQWFISHDGVTGEDSWFCERAKEKGFEIWMDRSVVVGHGFGDLHTNPIDFLAHMKYLHSLPPDEFERVGKIGIM